MMPGAILRTVLGDVDPASMGRVLPHEHLLLNAETWHAPGPHDRVVTWPPRIEDLWSVRENPMGYPENLILDNEAEAIAELELLKGTGFKTVIEVTSVGLNRNPEGLARIASSTGLNIIAGSSHYVGASLPFAALDLNVRQLSERIIQDIEQGINGTGIRAGVIGEVGLSWPLEESETRALEASVLAQRATGAAITIHSPFSEGEAEVLQEIVDLLVGWDADLDKVIMGHCDGFTQDPRFFDIGPQLGCALEFDMFGHEGFEWGVNWRQPSDHSRVEAIRTLTASGMADRILISQDITNKSGRCRYGGHGYGYIPRVIVPWLRSVGLSELDLDKILVGNPRRIFPLRRTSKLQCPDAGSLHNR